MGFFDELKRSSVIRVLLAYGAIAFAVGQAATSFFPALNLPDWSVTLVVALALLGFPVAAVLAWAYDVTDDGIVRADAVLVPRSSSRFRRIVAAVVIVLCIGFGVFLAMRRAGRNDLAVDRNLIAVLPFRVSGSDPALAYLREGMVDLLASALSVEEGTRAVDPRSTISAWRREVANEQNDLSPDSARLVGRALGAGRVLLGSVVGTPGNLTLIASIYPVEGNDKPIEARVVGAADTMQSLIDHLTAQLLSLEAGESRHRLATLTSTSLEAVKEYLIGQSQYRQARFTNAATHFNRALEADSTFALAAVGLQLTSGWGVVEASNLPRASRLIRSNRNRLSAPDLDFAQALVGEDAQPRTIRQTIDSWNAVITRYPDRADAWFQYGDVLTHRGRLVDQPDAWQQSKVAFNRALALDSSYTPALVHLIDFAAVFDLDPKEFHRLTAILERQPVSSDVAPYQYWTRVYFSGDSTRIRDFRANLDTMSLELKLSTALFAQIGVGTVDDALQAVESALRSAGSPSEEREALVLGHDTYMNFGRIDDALRLIERGLKTADSVAWHDAAVVDAMFWDGDTLAAAKSADRIASYLGGLPNSPAGQTPRDLACTLGQWRLRHRDVREIDRLLAILETPSGEIFPRPPDRLCAALLRALHASALNSPNAPALLERVDSLARIGYGNTFMLRKANATIAQLQEARGDTKGATRAQARFGGTGDMAQFLSVWRRQRGRLALLQGDTAEAVMQWTRYLRMYSQATGRHRALLDDVRSKLATITGERR
jgi:tetratricopeptide (TPR) repeat protein